MNIREAIQQTETALRAYAARDARGMPLIPVAMQRPIYLLGAPGLGKTAAVAEVAQRLQVGLVSCTLTHHTRQSALGLPKIVTRTFAGEEMSVTEYTMSEIIAEVYRYIEKTGQKKGILFLDEINCVSETLLPAVMELLQQKRFGTHRVPEGWMIVCAGNPEQYNRSARAFDPVAMDRVRVMHIEPDLNAWLEYAAENDVHPAVRSYLRLSPEDFYKITVDGTVTPRSWTDLSRMMIALETMGAAIDETLLEQYLQESDICKRFSMYLKMCFGMQSALDLNGVLDGNFAIAPEMQQKSFEEALFAATLLSERVRAEMLNADALRETAVRLEQFVQGAQQETGDFAQSCRERLARRENVLKLRKQVGGLSEDEERREKQLLDCIRESLGNAFKANDFAAALNAQMENARRNGETACRHAGQCAENAFTFMHQAFPRRVQIVMLSDLVHDERVYRALQKALPEKMQELEDALKPKE